MDNKSYSKGISWIDDCRIGTDIITSKPGMKPNNFQGVNSNSNKQKVLEHSYMGRFPANLLVSDDALNDGIKPNKGHRAKSKVSGYGDSKSRYYDIDKWFDKLLDNI
jgi:outer membrane protein assembly factor BamA